MGTTSNPTTPVSSGGQVTQQFVNVQPPPIIAPPIITQMQTKPVLNITVPAPNHQINPPAIPQNGPPPQGAPVPRKRGPIVWQGNLSVDTNTGNSTICKLQAHSMAPKFEKEKMFLNKWPAQIAIKHQLPPFHKDLIMQGIKMYQYSLCLWTPVFEDESGQKFDTTRYEIVIRKMEQSKLVAYFEINNENTIKHYLALFPYALYHSMKPNANTQPLNPALQKSMISVIIDSSIVKNQKGAVAKPPNTVQPPIPVQQGGNKPGVVNAPFVGQPRVKMVPQGSFVTNGGQPVVVPTHMPTAIVGPGGNTINGAFTTGFRPGAVISVPGTLPGGITPAFTGVPPQGRVQMLNKFLTMQQQQQQQQTHNPQQNKR